MRTFFDFNQLPGANTGVSQMSVFNASRFVSQCAYPTEESLRAAFPLSVFHKMTNGW